MTATKKRVAELTDRGVTIRVELVEQDRFRYQITGPNRFVATLPHCVCDQPGCAGDGVWRRACKKFTDPGGKYAHGREFCHGSSFGYHDEHAVALARAVLKSYRDRRKHKPGTIPHQEHRDPNRGLNHFAIVDGEEVIEVRPVNWHYGAATAWLAICDSPRCRVSRSEFPYREPEYEGPSKEGAEEAARQHRVWHSERFAIHPRIVLDAWIRNNAMAGPPEPDRAELDRQLAIARSGT